MIIIVNFETKGHLRKHNPMWNSLRIRYLFICITMAVAIGIVAQVAQMQSEDVRVSAETTINDYYGYHKAVESLKSSIEEIHHSIIVSNGSNIPRNIIDNLRENILYFHNSSKLCEDDHFAGICKALDFQVSRLSPDSSPAINEKSVRELQKIAHLIERRFYDSILDNTFKALDTSKAISQYIWIAAIIYAIVLSIGLISLELFIYRPLGLVAHAITAEGEGSDSMARLPSGGAAELSLLVKAFEGMRAQVRARQSRLQSVLDGTSDGIITVTEDGTIESMNRAARLIAGPKGDVVGRTIDALLNSDQKLWPPGGPHETIANVQRPDGTTRQLSLKYAEFQIDGLRRYNVMVADVTERQTMIDRLTDAAERDALTNLYNRRYFFQELERVCEQAKRQGGTAVALLSIDLDHFKFVNDTFGHQAGDALLIEISRKLSERVRKSDLLARLGGDEFAVLLFDVDADTAQSSAERFRARIADHPFHCDGCTVEIGCSLGVAMLNASVRDMEDLVARADMSCRHAKRQGRNRCHVFQEKDLNGFDQLTADMSITGRVRRVLEENLLRMAFQPIISLADGSVVGHEVLSRLQETPDDELRSAGPLIAEAERVGGAYDIDRWLFRTLFDAMARGQVPNPTGIFSVNLSGQTIGMPGFLEEIAQLLEDFSIVPRQLVFELTETTLISNTAQARQVVEGLKRLGARTALDDFGSGYCSFLYLKELPVDIVKLEGALVRGIDTNQVNLALVKSMHEVAAALGKQTVAEFIENKAVLRKLREIGVTMGQGHHFGAARPFAPETASLPLAPPSTASKACQIG